MKPLYKTTIVIWSEEDPSHMELSHLARDAETGNSYCAKSESVRVHDPAKDPDYDGTEFFGAEDDGEDEDDA